MPQILGAIIMVIAAAMRGTDRKLVRRLRSQGATAPAGAAPLPDLHALASWRLERLMGWGVIRRVEDDRYFLDEAGFRARRKKILLRVLPAIGLVLLVYYLVSVWQTP
jgi:hypothetical protein